MRRRVAIFGYGVAAYAVFLATFLYAVGFVGNLMVPTALDAPSRLGFGRALLLDVLLLVAFALQHSVMARPAFKRWWTRLIPVEAERSTYVLLSSLCLIAMFVWWAPLGGTVWLVQNAWGRAALYTLFAAGWGIVLICTFLINHFDLFGLRQVWLCLRGEPCRPLAFAMPWPYRQVRHPLYVGWLLAFWATPTMTLGHLFFALVTTAYILIAIQLEERDLAAAHPEYLAYRRQVPMLIPSLRQARGRVRTASAA
jgi:methanethiol S-methyltransferase